jgi:hypothetical protein
VADGDGLENRRSLLKLLASCVVLDQGGGTTYYGAHRLPGMWLGGLTRRRGRRGV